MGKTPAIPPVQDVPEAIAVVLRPLRENVELLKGRLGTRILKLGPTATDADRNNKINEIIDWLFQ
jgi:hypothetical protein